MTSAALNAVIGIIPQLRSPTSRRDSWGSNYFQTRIPTDGFRGRVLSTSRRNSNVSLPPIGGLPSAFSPQPPSKPKPKSHQKKQYKWSFQSNEKEWKNKKMEEMKSVPEDDYPQSLTPEPEIFKEFKVFKHGVAVLSEEQKKRSSFRPRYCWCGRCQRMYSLYKDNDPSLENWGNYPCHQW